MVDHSYGPVDINKIVRKSVDDTHEIACWLCDVVPSVTMCVQNYDCSGI